MKNISITIVTKKGQTRAVNVIVDDETAKVLETLSDENYKREYLYGEYLMQEREKWYSRKAVSLDDIVGSGIEPCMDGDLGEIIQASNIRIYEHKLTQPYVARRNYIFR